MKAAADADARLPKGHGTPHMLAAADSAASIFVILRALAVDRLSETFLLEARTVCASVPFAGPTILPAFHLRLPWDSDNPGNFS